MTDDIFTIHVTIGDNRFPLDIKRTEEQIYRDAATEVNNALNRYRRQFPALDASRIMTMVAYDMSYHMLLARQATDTEPFLASMRQLTKELETCLTDKRIDKQDEQTNIITPQAHTPS